MPRAGAYTTMVKMILPRYGVLSANNTLRVINATMPCTRIRFKLVQRQREGSCVVIVGKNCRLAPICKGGARTVSTRLIPVARGITGSILTKRKWLVFDVRRTKIRYASEIKRGADFFFRNRHRIFVVTIKALINGYKFLVINFQYSLTVSLRGRHPCSRMRVPRLGLTRPWFQDD